MHTPKGRDGKDAGLLRVLVCDDSAVMRTVLRQVFEGEHMRVIAEATSGEEAVRLAATLRPDVITMDVNMPGIDGLEATRRIMHRSPTPIVIVSSLQGNDPTLSVRALAAGALAVMAKPRGSANVIADQERRALSQVVRQIAGVRLVTEEVTRGRAPVGRTSNVVPEIVGIASSTGGPQVLATISRALPPDLSVPVVILQHISPGFEEALVSVLTEASQLPVRLAHFGAHALPGTIYVAPGGAHLTMGEANTFILDEGPPIEGHRPSATPLFRSMAHTYGKRCAAIMLSGMGQDGAEGLADLRSAGGYVIAQDPATCIAPSMPGAALARDAVDAVAAPSEIVPTLLSLFGKHSS